MVVFSCGDLGSEVAQRLLGVPEVGQVSLITAPYSRKRLGLRAKMKQVYRNQGILGLLRVAASKLLPVTSDKDSGTSFGAVDARIRHLHFPDLHCSECLAALKELNPDLGVVAGTYILKEPVFSAPRLGCINLHTGKVPEYRGAAPAFWELYNGESVVGITIHRVAAAVDAGSVLAQEVFPFDNTPEGDPISYIERYRREVLRPNAIRMAACVVEQIASGTAVDRPQDEGKGTTYKSPDYRAICELRRRVKARRAVGRRSKGAGK